jgi:hypothetical protein
MQFARQGGASSYRCSAVRRRGRLLCARSSRANCRLLNYLR